MGGVKIVLPYCPSLVHTLKTILFSGAFLTLALLPSCEKTVTRYPEIQQNISHVLLRITIRFNGECGGDTYINF